VLWTMFVIMLAGLALTMAGSLALIIAGLAVITFGFFGGHSIVSSWVGRRAGNAKAQASSMYLFAYYLGSSLAGPRAGCFTRLTDGPEWPPSSPHCSDSDCCSRGGCTTWRRSPCRPRPERPNLRCLRS